MGIYLIVAGIIMFAVVAVALVTVLKVWWGVIGFVCLGAGVFLYGMGMESVNIGRPKTSIEVGSYAVEGYIEISQDKQLYYQLMLEQDGKVKLYALPKDMINTVYQLPETSEKSGTLEVVEKSGLRKATLYIPLRK